jgi:hypothetical protein
MVKQHRWDYSPSDLPRISVMISSVPPPIGLRRASGGALDVVLAHVAGADELAENQRANDNDRYDDASPTL